MATVINKSIVLLKHLGALSKIRIPLAVSMSALAGFVLNEESVSIKMILPVLGVFFLSSASAALNSLQEMNFDARMSRTENRPLPSKRISKAVAGSFILIAFISGVLLLFLFGGLIPATIGLITFIWYNFLYTPLKRLTSSALFVGAFVGAFPPLIGWTAAGGNLLDVKILSLCLMIFIWQVPHFMLLLLYHGSEYQKAGFKVLSNYLSPFQLRFLIRIWIYATSFSVLPLWFSGIIITPLIFIIVIILAAILSFTITSIISKPEINYRKAFMLINAYLIIQLLLIIVDHLN